MHDILLFPRTKNPPILAGMDGLNTAYIGGDQMTHEVNDLAIKNWIRHRVLSCVRDDFGHSLDGLYIEAIQDCPLINPVDRPAYQNAHLMELLATHPFNTPAYGTARVEHTHLGEVEHIQPKLQAVPSGY